MFNKKHLPSYLFIVFSLFLALSPVILSNNYLRQDDLMWELWPDMKMSDFGYLYYNTVYQLVRPLCMLSFYITDLISINIHHSVYVRFLSIVTISICGILLYRWQLLFKNNRLLAATFAISAFTLPGYQIFAATANYFLILFALLLTFGSMYAWYKAFDPTTGKIKRPYFILGCLLFFASLLEYPLSSMYIWTFLAIFYLASLSNSLVEQAKKQQFFNYIAITTVGMMIAYYVFIILFHKIFQVDLSGTRTAVVHTAHLISRLMQIFDILSWHSSFWFWDNTYPLSHSPLFPLLGLLILALIRVNRLIGISSKRVLLKRITFSLVTLFALFFLAYSPVFASPDYIITYRYTLATMPILLYALFWSIETLFCSGFWKYTTLTAIGNKIAPLILISITFIGIGYANLMIADGIVGPHQHDFMYIQSQLEKKVIPLLQKNKKVIIHAIDCEGGKSYVYGKNVPTSIEYGMRTCQYQQQVIGVILHSLMSMGYLSNFHAHNTVIYNDNEIIVKNTPWGDLIVNSKEKMDPRYSHQNNLQLVTIDMRSNSSYNQYDFYKSVFKK